MKKIAIIGATSAVAQHCARLWVKDNAIDLHLVGRNKERVDLIAADLRVRSPNTIISLHQVNFLDPLSIQEIANKISRRSSVDIVLIAHGSLPEQKKCQSNIELCKNTLEVNSISPVLFAEAFAGYMERVNSGTLAIIGSVAGDRGRRSNYVYGSSKGLVKNYTQGIQHRLANSAAKVVLIKLGPTDTPMTAHLKNQGVKLAAVEDVAQKIVQAIEKNQPVVYVPGKWRLIMWVIIHLPRFIFNKLDI